MAERTDAFVPQRFFLGVRLSNIWLYEKCNFCTDDDFFLILCPRAVILIMQLIASFYDEHVTTLNSGPSQSL